MGAQQPGEPERLIWMLASSLVHGEAADYLWSNNYK
jgi:hypothetical protein